MKTFSNSWVPGNQPLLILFPFQDNGDREEDKEEQQDSKDEKEPAEVELP